MWREYGRMAMTAIVLMMMMVMNEFLVLACTLDRQLVVTDRYLHQIFISGIFTKLGG